MKIINVVEIKNGVVSSIESFPIWENFFSEEEAVEAAEERFLSKAVQNGMKLRESGDALDRGNYDGNNGYEVLIHWSAINVNE